MGRRFYDTTLIMAGKICPYCGQPTEYVDSAAVYHGISYGMIYLCRKCDAYVGVHRGTDKALGRLANRSLREWKKRAHYYFDPISRTPLINRIWPKYIPGISNRNKAYRWLAAQMGVEPEVCHIGMFDECMRVLEPFGILIFKWNESQIPVSRLLEIFGQEPLFGHRSGKASKTHWMCFMKK